MDAPRGFGSAEFQFDAGLQQPIDPPFHGTRQPSGLFRKPRVRLDTLTAGLSSFDQQGRDPDGEAARWRRGIGRSLRPAAGRRVLDEQFRRPDVLGAEADADRPPE